MDHSNNYLVRDNIDYEKLLSEYDKIAVELIDCSTVVTGFFPKQYARENINKKAEIESEFKKLKLNLFKVKKPTFRDLKNLFIEFERNITIILSNYSRTKFSSLEQKQAFRHIKNRLFTFFENLIKELDNRATIISSNNGIQVETQLGALISEFNGQSNSAAVVEQAVTTIETIELPKEEIPLEHVPEKDLDSIDETGVISSPNAILENGPYTLDHYASMVINNHKELTEAEWREALKALFKLYKFPSRIKVEDKVIQIFDADTNFKRIANLLYSSYNLKLNPSEKRKIREFYLNNFSTIKPVTLAPVRAISANKDETTEPIIVQPSTTTTYETRERIEEIIREDRIDTTRDEAIPDDIIDSTSQEVVPDDGNDNTVQEAVSDDGNDIISEDLSPEVDRIILDLTTVSEHLDGCRKIVNQLKDLETKIDSIASLLIEKNDYLKSILEHIQLLIDKQKSINSELRSLDLTVDNSEKVISLGVKLKEIFAEIEQLRTFENQTKAEILSLKSEFEKLTLERDRSSTANRVRINIRNLVDKLLQEAEDLVSQLYRNDNED